MPFELKGLSSLIDGLSAGSSNATPAEGGSKRVIAGRFELIREIGRGGMGIVYLARQRSMDRNVAIKVLAPENDCASARERFRHEAAAVSRLRDPHTISVYDFGEADGELFLVMELLEGKPLSHWMKQRGPFGSDLVQEIIDQVLDSLAEAHQSGLLHRDLKPDNIFLRELSNGRMFAKVLDFGLAKLMAGNLDDCRTLPGIVFGTPAYMSPEQVLGHELDERSDLYSVAVVMFEMLTGTLPVRGKTALELGVKKTRVSPLKLEDANPNVDYPPGARQFFEHALALNPVMRPADTEQFRRFMSKSFDRKPAAGRGQRRAIPDIYHARPTLPEHAAPFNRDGVSPDVPVIQPDSRDEPTEPNPKRELQAAAKRVTPVIRAEGGIPGDRRRSRRGSHLNMVRIFSDGDENQGTATDISTTGAFISSTFLPQKGSRVTILFRYPGGRDYAVSILGEVTRVSAGTGGPGDVRGFGIHWLKLRAVGDIGDVFAFLTEALGIQKKPQVHDGPGNTHWEFIFESGGVD
ncbi:MAG TPA: serine/threonine-protein kinase [Myxococcota bacterium]|nr:serine/threonine-protein kinase [Myxococcota bacterium]